ncbi:MAG: DUF4166 domain-containing protein [Paracoccaceae bacterium]
MSLFSEALGADWAALPASVRAFHEGPATRFRGEARVERGTNRLARRIAGAFGFPPSAETVPVTIAIAREGHVERWHRDFGGHALSTRLAPAGPGRVREHVGPSAFDLALVVRDGRLHLDVAAGRLGRLPLPGVLLPLSEAVEFATDDGAFGFDIAVALRGLGPMIRYRGRLVAEDA